MSRGVRITAGLATALIAGAVSVSAAGPRSESDDDGARRISGFRMEGDPAIEMVFGDTERFQQHVDRFYALLDDMRDIRGEFTRHVRSTMSTLAAHKQRCPIDAVAPLYAQAYESGKVFRELGAEMEGHHSAIAALDELGETAGLTPDYRWRVRRAGSLYDDSLRDYREMRSVFERQLGGEIAFHRCDTDRLLAEGARILAERKAAERRAAATAATPAADPAVPRVAAATFFVDNRACPGAVRVFIDGLELGNVAARSKAAFQALPGRHSMCLIPSANDAACGDPGTLRQVYVHDGWAMTLRCE